MGILGCTAQTEICYPGTHMFLEFPKYSQRNKRTRRYSSGDQRRISGFRLFKLAFHFINRALTEQHRGKMKKRPSETSLRKKQTKQHFVIDLQIKSGTLPSSGVFPHALDWQATLTRWEKEPVALSLARQPGHAGLLQGSCRYLVSLRWLCWFTGVSVTQSRSKLHFNWLIMVSGFVSQADHLTAGALKLHNPPLLIFFSFLLFEQENDFLFREDGEHQGN